MTPLIRWFLNLQMSHRDNQMLKSLRIFMTAAFSYHAVPRSSQVHCVSSVLKGVKVVRVGFHDRNWNILNESILQVLAVGSNYPCLTPVSKVLGHEHKLAPKPALIRALKAQAGDIRQCLNCVRRVPFFKNLLDHCGLFEARDVTNKVGKTQKQATEFRPITWLPMRFKGLCFFSGRF